LRRKAELKIKRKSNTNQNKNSKISNKKHMNKCRRNINMKQMQITVFLVKIVTLVHLFTSTQQSYFHMTIVFIIIGISKKSKFKTQSNNCWPMLAVLKNSFKRIKKWEVWTQWFRNSANCSSFSEWLIFVFCYSELNN
jgi:hypothetical protein